MRVVALRVRAVALRARIVALRVRAVALRARVVPLRAESGTPFLLISCFCPPLPADHARAAVLLHGCYSRLHPAGGRVPAQHAAVMRPSGGRVPAGGVVLRGVTRTV